VVGGVYIRRQASECGLTKRILKKYRVSGVTGRGMCEPNRVWIAYREETKSFTGLPCEEKLKYKVDRNDRWKV